MNKIGILLTFLLLSCVLLHAEVRLSHIFSDNMVIQRDKPIVIWGWADKNEPIEITLNDNTVKGKADKQGYWHLTLQSMKYGGPYIIDIKGRKNSISLNNILIGDVWLCSGQSNMQFRVHEAKNAETEITDAHHPNIRAFNVKQEMSFIPANDFSGAWQECTPSTVGDFTAVGYYFARKINEETGIPIGIINSSWGGTEIETWISPDAFAKLPAHYWAKYKDIQLGKDVNMFAKENAEKKQAYHNALKSDPGITQSWYNPKMDKNEWEQIIVPKSWSATELNGTIGYVWFSYDIYLPDADYDVEAELSLGGIDDEDISWVNGVKVGETNKWDTQRLYTVPKNTLESGKNTITVKIFNGSGEGGVYGKPEDMYLQIGNIKYPLAGKWFYKTSVTNREFNYIDFTPNIYPSLLYNAMVNPITQFAIKGVLWYQGESNDRYAYDYRALFPYFINNWRNKWGYEFPFYWVQLANYKAKDEAPQESDWAELREAQSLALALPRTGQAVITDIGEANDIHPCNKQDVGLRLALISLNKDYNKKNIVYSGPTYKSMKIEGNKVIISFDNIGSGLRCTNKYGYIEGFAIAGTDKKYMWAKAYIDGDNVVVYNEYILQPIAVRYAWGNNPDVNLYNVESLPTAPFRTDN